ncbi:MAG: hypothetical protein KKH74_08925 [Gammaproteobacteria bacterium]|nr:hypothetical protein [Gammaproteobacteria bacterium]MBU1732632.1 hypothetical protein [Gammaproteobacteria bacterium]MBU1893495.1 hypothetical protein [Gammaproteobacteria bacterium]
MSEFIPLAGALAGYFDKALDELPDALRKRVLQNFPTKYWDEWTPHQRRSEAEQLDAQDVAAHEEYQEIKKEFLRRMHAIEKEIEEWKSVDAPTAGDMARKKKKLVKLKKKLAPFKNQLARGDFPGLDENGTSEVPIKPPGHLNHDPEMQTRANQIAAEQKPLTRRPITRNMVANILAEERGMNVETVLRRIRKQW